MTKKTPKLPDIIAVGAKHRNKRPPRSEAEAESRRKASERCRTDPRFVVNLGAGNEFADNQPGDYEKGVKVRNLKGNNQFTHPGGLKIYDPRDVRKLLDAEAPSDFCESVGLPQGEGKTVGDCIMWRYMRECVQSTDAFRRDRALELLSRLAEFAQQETAKQGVTPNQSNVGVLNAPRITNIHFIDPPKKALQSNVIEATPEEKK